MINKLHQARAFIGNTPLIQLENKRIEMFAKLEYHNLMNSIKVRPAYHILKTAIQKGEITSKTTVIESSSGNFGIALAALCKQLQIKFIPVIDANINSAYEDILYALSYRVEKVTERDGTGGYLLNRLQRVEELLQKTPHSYWPNQYENPLNYESHYYGLGSEIAHHFETLDYAFIGVSTGGTIAGISQRLKEKFPHIKIVAVDLVGSVIFGGPPKMRHIPGIGASMVPKQIERALIDDVVMVEELDAIRGCHRLFEEHGVFAGGSSGSCYHAIHCYFSKMELAQRPKVVFLCPDGGTAYVKTVYNDEWVAHLRQKEHVTN
ncbi:2,3-diaminopropionate biosynthesis protein SbnA [Marininema halotolerans]|uniref:Cysteine synthase A n=1 Tax=Marininema halotolerans TaxID=1155944 RepID=A0A1I6PX21_9BACL|nr:2,3-diaminopropionate biosynthesis protein SbnA [Marininema halotolerans]SFS44595.1 cysteine synthase A [Marininema halotolerans]